jgi:hypothetical protein
MDINDWIEEKLGWGAALPLLQRIVFLTIEPRLPMFATLGQERSGMPPIASGEGFRYEVLDSQL